MGYPLFHHRSKLDAGHKWDESLTFKSLASQQDDPKAKQSSSYKREFYATNRAHSSLDLSVKLDDR
jgi:hypothetical protein